MRQGGTLLSPRIYFWAIVVVAIATLVGIIVTRGTTELGVMAGGALLVGVILILRLRAERGGFR